MMNYYKQFKQIMTVYMAPTLWKAEYHRGLLYLQILTKAALSMGTG